MSVVLVFAMLMVFRIGEIGSLGEPLGEPLREPLREPPTRCSLD